MESFSFEIPFHNEDIFFIKIGSTEVYSTISYVAGDNQNIAIYIVARQSISIACVNMYFTMKKWPYSNISRYIVRTYVVCKNKIWPYISWRAHSTPIDPNKLYLHFLQTIIPCKKIYTASTPNANIVHTKNILRIPKRYYLK